MNKKRIAWKIHTILFYTLKNFKIMLQLLPEQE